jgi:hypothetical protein
LHESVRREHLGADPDDADADVGECGVDDVLVVQRAVDESAHDGRHARAGADVLAELDPRRGHTGRDRVRVGDFVIVGHELGVLAGERGVLPIDGQWGRPDVGPRLVDERDELRLVGRGVVATGAGRPRRGHEH